MAMDKIWVLLLCFNLAWCNLQKENAQDTCGDCMSILECKEASPHLNLTEETLRRIDKFICGITNYSFNVCCSKFNNYLRDKSHPNLKLLPDNCGHIFNSIGDRIFSGVVSEINEFPWMVLIAYKNRLETDLSFKCSGTLINSRYVLTAAHCVHNADIAGVRVGEHQIGTDVDCKDNVCVANSVKDRQVNEAIIHEDYNPFDNNANDIALLRLAEIVNLTFVNPGAICLPITEELQNRPITKRWGMVAGWGRTEYGQESSLLLKVTVPVRSNEECQKKIRYISTSDLKWFCAGIQTRDSCDGDSGGPFMLQDSYKGTNKIVQYGIVSAGGTSCGSDTPGVYTNVRNYVKWILDNIRE